MTDLETGTAVPPLERTIDLASMVAYAGATWDWHRLHYDPEYVQRAKLPGPVVDGQVLGALIAEQLMDWLGPEAFLRTLEFRFKSMVFAGDTVVCTGEVTNVGDGVVHTAHTVHVGDRLVMDATAEVRR